ncbi:MAG: hypothetical protein V1906_00760 [Candidatus Woesearchaeota archaeon]
MKNRRIVSVCLILCLALSVSPAYGAEFSEQGMYDWLKGQSADGSYNNDVLAAAWAAVAFGRANMANDADSVLAWLDTNKNAQSCWSSQSCLTKETALVTLANQIANKDTTPMIEYFKRVIMGHTTAGSWMLEITTPSTGKCKISYDVNNISESKDIDVAEGKFPGCGNTNFLDLNTCLKPNLIKAKPNMKFNVDCSSLDTAPIITLVYKSGGSFYLVSTSENSVSDVVVPNGCFGRSAGDTCNKDSTFFSAWVLNEVGSDLDTSVYLRESYEQGNGMHNAILYFISKDPRYLAELKKLQSTDGSLGRDVLQTALAIKAWGDDPTTYDALIQRAKSYIQGRQRDDGSINGNVIDTAAAIYGAYGYGATSTATCSDNIENGDERGIDCGGVCESTYGRNCCDNGVADGGEEGIDCGGVCDACTPGTETCNLDDQCQSEAGETSDNCADCKTTSSICVENNNCEIDFGENFDNCPADCRCGDGKCDGGETKETCSQDCGASVASGVGTSVCGDGTCDSDETTESCDVDCPSTEGGSSFGTIMLILILLAALGVGGYFAYKKGLIKLPIGKPKGPSGPGYSPFTSRLPPQRSAPGQPPAGVPRSMPMRQPMARQAAPPSGGLGSSLSEARKLLKK